MSDLETPLPSHSCCDRHHYTCAIGEEGVPPMRCCHNCPCYPDHPEWVFGTEGEPMTDAQRMADRRAAEVLEEYANSVRDMVVATGPAMTEVDPKQALLALADDLRDRAAELRGEQS